MDDKPAVMAAGASEENAVNEAQATADKPQPAPADDAKPAEQPAPAAEKDAGPSDSDRIGMIVDVLRQNGMSLPKKLK